MKNSAPVLFLLFCLFSVPNARSADTQAVANFNALVDGYFDFYFSFHPTEATSAGFHQHDPKLEDYSAAALGQEVSGLKDNLEKFEAVDGTKLPPDVAADRE